MSTSSRSTSGRRSTRSQPGRPKAQRRRREGAAYVEAVLVIPSLILCFALVMFVREGYTKAAHSSAETRQHGWAHVMGACNTDVPSETEMAEQVPFDLAGLATLALISTRLLGVADNQPMLIPNPNTWIIGGYVIEKNRYSQSHTFRRPDSIGGDARYGHQIVLTCDEDIAKFEMPGLPNSLGTTLWNFTAWVEAAALANPLEDD